MKKEISPALAAVVVIVVVLLAGVLFWRGMSGQQSAGTPPPPGPVPLPPSQQGTRLGNQTLGTEVGSPNQTPPGR